jgi:cyclopropane fatty-acyl-phospholipid synthase-like methyltransferase
MAEDYYQTKESVEDYIKLAKDADGRQLIKKLKKYLLPNSSLLEIGSGPGTDFQLLKKDFRVVGSDYSAEFLRRLKDNHLNDRFLQLNAITLETKQKFDGIYSNKVLQHLTDNELKKSIKRQSVILNAGGIVCHSFWKGEGEEIYNGLLVNYQLDTSLRSLFENHFEILMLEEYKEFEEKDSILLIGKKKRIQ